MGVRANYEVSGHDYALLRKERVLNPDVSAVKVVGEFLLRGELAKNLALSRAQYVLIGGKVVGNKHHALPIKNLFRPYVPEFLYGDGRGYVVTERDIHLRDQKLPGTDLLKPGVLREDLLRHGHGPASFSSYCHHNNLPWVLNHSFLFFLLLVLEPVEC